MKTRDRIELLSKLKCVLIDVSTDKEWESTNREVSQQVYDEFRAAIDREHIYNGWFTKVNIQKSIQGIASWLTPQNIENWLSNYSNINPKAPKKVGIIMAGNIPLVGFHDFMSVFLSGNKSLIKLSSDDKHLFGHVLEVLEEIDSNITEWIEFVDRLSGFDAVIATGSNNSATYFNSYFEKYPHIIRKNRTSVAIINGDESKVELSKLGDDIFNYFGLGCRNVTQILIPEDFVLDRFFEAIFEFDPIINHNKYANNYDYNKAVYLLNLEPLLDNGFILLKEDDSLNSPLSVLFYKRYKSKNEVVNFLNSNSEKIQAIIGENHIGFGDSQKPTITDYADNVDTMAFLTNL